MSLRRWIAWLALLASAALAASAWSQVAATKHNLSISGPGTVKASTESEICIFCHTPHNASPAGGLWNRRNPAAAYTPYSSSTAKGAAGQPNGASLQCLSCHDGTIALGDVLSRATPIAMAGATSVMPAGAGRLGTDLGDDHPVSFAYTAALVTQRNNELVSPTALPPRTAAPACARRSCHSRPVPVSAPGPALR